MRAPRQPRTRKRKPSAGNVLIPPGDASELAAVLASADLALIHVDTQLRLRGFTPAMADLLDVTPADLGRPLRELKQRFSDEALESDLQAVLREPAPLEAEVVSHSGRAYVRRALPYRRTRGQVDGVVLTFTDITRRKLAETALRSSEERHRLILNSVPEYAILTLDTEGRLLTWSAQAERMLGYTPDQIIGRPAALLYGPESKKNGNGLREFEQAREGRSVTFERWYFRKDGQRFWATEVMTSLHDEAGRLYGFVKAIRDNSERKLVDERLRQAKIDAEMANSAKDHFLANISHELRTPLSAMLLWGKLLSGRGPAAPNRAQINEGLEAILKSAQEQQALIEDLMDTSRIVAGKLRLEPKDLDLGQLVQTGVGLIRPAAAEKSVQLDARIDEKAGVVHADPLRLQQVLSNLLNNAVKFTPPGGRVTVILQRRGSNITLDVVDTGQGISPEFLPRVFDRFTQAENSTIRTNGGMGLGLSIVRQLVHLHGGEITVHSDGLAKGSTFSVVLPLARVLPAQHAAKPRAGKTSSLKGLAVLLVEDMPETRKALVAVLNSAGATVVPAANAQGAIKAFNDKRPDLILSDIGLGKISGHDLIGQIRQWEVAQKIPPVPALALTAFADQKNRELALISGFQQVLTKPVEPFEVIDVLASLYAANN